MTTMAHSSFLIALVTVAGLAWNVSCTTREKRPHVIIFLVDDLGYDDVSFHGSNQILTPNIDALAYDGIILNNYYTQSVCTPSRAALMTGRHPTQLGLQHFVIASSQPYGLGLNETLMPEYFKKLGYSTHMVGKWHLGYYAKEFTPTERGFDTFLGYYSGMEDYYDHTYQVNTTVWGLDFRDNLDPEMDSFGQYSTDLFAAQAVDLINKHDLSKPMFLYLPFQGVHTGNVFEYPLLEAPWKYTSRFPHIPVSGRRTYAGMLSAVDDAIVAVARTLYNRGMLNDSVIMFSSDNGGQVNSPKGAQSSNWPLRGMKYTQWEGGNKGSGFIWSPRLARSGYTSEHMMQIEDVMPTLLGAAGYDTGSLPSCLYGLDMWQALSHNTPGPRHQILHNIDPLTGELALRVGDMKVITSGPDGYTAKIDGWYHPINDSAMGVSELLDKFQAVARDGPVDIETVIDRSMLEHYQTKDTAKQYESARQELTNSGVFDNDLSRILSSLGRPATSRRPAVVNCGQRPTNKTYDCDVGKHPCLFNITADPCEYRNLAATHPELLATLLTQAKHYQAAAAPPKNKPQDPAGFPQNHHGRWDPWVQLTKSQLRILKDRKVAP